MMARFMYVPQFGQTTCVGTAIPQFEQDCSSRAFRASCERRIPVREFDCLRFGTAMATSLYVEMGGRLDPCCLGAKNYNWPRSPQSKRIILGIFGQRVKGRLPLLEE